MDGFSESGGAAALTMASPVQANLFATIGLRGSTEFVLEDDMTLTLRGGLGWWHRFGDDASILFVYKSVPQSAATSVWAGVVADAAEVGGRYCENCHVATVTEAELRSDAEGVRPYALDAERAKALWAKSEEMVGQRFP